MFPGNVQLKVVDSLDTHPPEQQEKYPVFRLMNPDGTLREGVDGSKYDKDELLKMYTYMTRVQSMDTVFYDAQRQGRISFYMQVGLTLVKLAINLDAYAVTFCRILAKRVPKLEVPWLCSKMILCMRNTDNLVFLCGAASHFK